MAGPISKTQPKAKDRPQQVGDLQPEVSRQFDDEPPVDLAQPQPQAGTPRLHEDETHPQPGTSQHINTGDSATAKPDGGAPPQRQS